VTLLSHQLNNTNRETLRDAIFSWSPINSSAICSETLATYEYVVATPWQTQSAVQIAKPRLASLPPNSV
jgi:hypothetical protein